MSQHLTSRQISECLMGVSDPSGQWHVNECSACRAEIETIERPLALFRTSVRHWSGWQMDGHHRYSLARPVIKAAGTSGPWEFFGRRVRTAGAYSAMIHCAVVALLFALGSARPVSQAVRVTATLIAPDLKSYQRKARTMQGGGGGGTRSLLDASKGKLPKTAPRQFAPPRVDPLENPKLPMTPVIVSDLEPPKIDLPNDGDPLSHLGIPSNGTGLALGIGNGFGGGVGTGDGPGVGPGSNGGFTGGVYRAGGGVSSPVVLSQVEPEYSDDARRAKFQGMVVLQLVVDEKGMPGQIRVVRPLGLGLDQKAIEAVAKWRFKPGMKDGKPVAVVALIEVNFRLL
jgi:periplasmic protein TonB